MKIGIVGLGLMGGSFGRAIKKKTSHTVYGFDLSEQTMKKAELLGCMDARLGEDNAGEIDVLAVFVYPSAFVSAAERFLPYMKEGSVVIDGAGNKRVIVESMRELKEKYAGVNFIATHPMAGREFSGVEHSTEGLFEGCFWLIVPVSSELPATASVKKLIYDVGARKVIHTTAEEHDRTIAYTSQLCHIISGAYVKSPTAESGLGYTAGSFRDLTRVARLSPEMWSELFLQNADMLAPEIECVIGKLSEYLAAIQSGDKPALESLLKEGSDKKIALERAHQKFVRENDEDKS